MMVSRRKAAAALGSIVLITAIAGVALGQSSKRPVAGDAEKAVLARLAEIQNAAQALDPDKVFSYVLENDKGALAQNGTLFLTRQEALDSTRHGFQGLQKIEYKFDQQHVALLSPTIALAIGGGNLLRDDSRWQDVHHPFRAVCGLRADERRVEGVPRSPVLGSIDVGGTPRPMAGSTKAGSTAGPSAG
jgi:hypothetical protein